jgi:hypothetical protein
MCAELLHRRTVLLGIASGLITACALASAQSGGGANKPLFELHSGFWINLHHFLYAQARKTLSKQSAREVALTASDMDALQRLSPAERAAWDRAVAYYAASIAERDLLFDDDLVAIKNALEDAENSTDLAQAPVPGDLRQTLLKASPIYRAHWWMQHDALIEQDWKPHMAGSSPLRASISKLVSDLSVLQAASA